MAMKKISCINSRWKAAVQSKDWKKRRRLQFKPYITSLYICCRRVSDF